MKLLIILLLQVLIVSNSFGQSNFIQLAGIDYSLGMKKSFVLKSIAENYKIEFSPEANVYHIFEKYNENISIGIVQFDDQDNLVNINKEWGFFSENNTSSAMITLYNLISKLNNQNLSVSTNEYFEPNSKLKTIDFKIENKSIQIGINESGSIFINESLIIN